MNMKNTTTRAASLIICVSLLASIPACGSGSGTQDDTTAGGGSASDDTTTAAETEAHSPLYDLERKDYGGREFRISISDKWGAEMWVEEEDGDVCNDAVYNRNLKVEDYYNVRITPVITKIASNTTHVEEVQKTLLAGEDLYDLTALYTCRAGWLALDGLLYNWRDIKGVDFSKEWWIQSANDAFTIGGNQYMAVGDLSITTLLLSYAVFFNQRIIADYNLPNLYETVLDGNWTIDELLNCSKDIYQDLNNNEKVDKDDLLGFAADKVTNLDAWPAAFNIPLVTKDKDGKLSCNLNLDRMQTGLEKVYSLYYDTKAYISSGDGSEIKAFANGNIAFLTTWIDNSFNTLRDMKDDYGILPYPKFDEEQTNYYSNAMDNYSVLSVPKTVKPEDAEFVGTITEALTRENHYSVISAYYDVALGAKYARDEQSVAMLDIIMSGRQYDMSILHASSLERLPYLFRDLIAAKKTDVASKYASIESAVKAGLDDLTETYAELAK